MLRGAEENQRYRLDERGQPVVSGVAERLSPAKWKKSLPATAIFTG
jgi:hypothetical protein